MTPKISLLINNLTQVHSALLAEGKPHLVANLKGNKLYTANSIWGRMWRVIYYFCAIDHGKSNLEKALHKTETLFQEILPSLLSKAKTVLGYSWHEEIKFDQERKELCWLIYRLSPFLKSSLRLERKVESLWKKKRPFITQEQFQVINRARWVLAFENATQVSADTAFLRLIHKNLISPNDMRKFVYDINQAGLALAPHVFPSLLDAFGYNTQEVTCNLLKNGLELLMQEDDDFLLWQKRLRKGDTIEWAGQRFRFSGERVTLRLDGEPFTLFSLQDQPFQIVMGKNRLRHWYFHAVIEEGKTDTEWFPVRMGPKLTCVEKMMPVESWHTLKGPAKEEGEYSLKQLLWHMRKTEKVPIGFSKDNLFISEKGRLSYIGQVKIPCYEINDVKESLRTFTYQVTLEGSLLREKFLELIKNGECPSFF